MSPTRFEPKDVGRAPGAAVYRGEGYAHSPSINALCYGPDGATEHEKLRLEDLSELARSGQICWLDVDGVHDVATVQAICRAFEVHPLATEEILDTEGRVKVDDLGDCLYVLAKMLTPDRAPDGHAAVHVEQISVVLLRNMVITFQEQPGDVFEPLRGRILKGTGRVRRMPAEYLLHGILDALVDGVFVVLEHLTGLSGVVVELEHYLGVPATVEASPGLVTLEQHCLW